MLQVFKDGRPVNAALSQKDLSDKVKLEEHTAVVDRFLSSKDGTYGWQGALSRGGSLTVPKATLKESSFAKDRVARVRARLNRGEPPLLVSYDLETDTPIFSEEDQEAYEDGYICGNCLQYQNIPNAPVCNWLRVGDSSNVDPKYKGCGHRNF